MLTVQLVFGLVLLAGTALQQSSARVAQFDANNVTKMEFTFQGVPGRDGMNGQPGPVGPQGTYVYVLYIIGVIYYARSTYHITACCLSCA